MESGTSPLWLAVFTLIFHSTANAQFTDRASQPWRTVETENFIFHFPEPLTPWALPVAARFESVRSAVQAVVGAAPKQRVTVVMDDPVTISNGLAAPDVNEPVMLFLATPPGPRSQTGDYRDWSELLAVHEFTHIAHMTRPSRNRLRRFLGVLTGAGPITTRAPRWVVEGYATYVEGKLTGTGRPHGVWRAAVLRQWALEGKLPSYSQLNSFDGFQGGAFAYLAGSAYLEWLVQQRGDSSLVHLWRRLTARRNRSFSSAFRGVFGDVPSDLYGRFQVELTGNALEIERRVKAAGLIDGETVQALKWYTGDPAVSRDGSRMAIVLRGEREMPRLVIWNTAEPPADTTKEAARLRRMLERDPEDVPDIRTAPRAKKVIATLRPAAGGRAYDEPRFLPDGKRVLVIRYEPQSDGSLRPDVFIWDYERGEVRQVTHEAAIVAADATPDGRAAIGVQCRWGSCGLVRIDLENSDVETIVAGAPNVTYYRPRVSPDGRFIVAGVQRAGRWRTELISIDGSQQRVIGPDDGAERYDAAFVGDGSNIVVTSEAGGVPNIELIDIASGAARSLTRVVGAATAPEPASDGFVYFLRTHAKGLDLARVRVNENAGAVISLDSMQVPAAPNPLMNVPTFQVAELPQPRRYGWGDRQYRFLPELGIGRGGLIVGLNVMSADPVGRLTWLLQTQFGESEWSGQSLRTAVRRIYPFTISTDVFRARHRLYQSTAAPFALPELNSHLTGAWLAFGTNVNTGAMRGTGRLGVSWLELDTDVLDRADRWMFHTDAEITHRLPIGRSEIVATLGAHFADGKTDDAGGWRRTIEKVALGVRPRAAPGLGATVEAVRGRTTDGFEKFLIGGDPPRFFDAGILSQRRPMPALPAGALGGRKFTEIRASITGASFSPYIWMADTDERAGWYKVIGIEQQLDTPPIPLLRVPGSEIVVGVGYTLDEQPERTWRFYATTTLRP